MFTLPRVISEMIFNVMLNLGASINVMTYHVYLSLKLNEMQSTTVVIQLADRWYIQPLRIAKDILVQVKSLIFIVDFYIFKIYETITPSSFTSLLRRSFKKIAKTKIDVDQGFLFIDLDVDVVSFNTYDAMKFPEEYFSLCYMDVVLAFCPLISN